MILSTTTGKMAVAEPPFLQLPVELRMMIYEYLFDTGSQENVISIRNKARRMSQASKKLKVKRSAYHILERNFVRRSYKTTYCHEDEESEMHPAVLAVCRKLRAEASHYLYGMHAFHFGPDLEAVVPFLGDRTPYTIGLVREITLHKRGIPNMVDSDSYGWSATCRFLQSLPKLLRLRLVIEGGRPRLPWDGPQELSVSDLKLLYMTRHESMEWARELADVKVIEHVEISAQMQPIPQPKTTEMLIYAAFSASIETTLVEFLKSELGINAALKDHGRLARQSSISSDESIED